MMPWGTIGATSIALVMLILWVRALKMNGALKKENALLKQLLKSYKDAVNEMGPLPATDNQQLDWLHNDDR